ncbi:MAG: hypothetical protein WEA56_01180 [Balneolaceae bacterium]
MKFLLPFLFFALSVTAEPLLAQFEGKVEYRITTPENPDDEPGNFYLTFTKNRLFIQSDNEMNVMSGLNTNGVLVRSDQNDFIFITGPDEALQINKDDIDGLVSMMNRVQGNSGNSGGESFNWNERVEETGNTQRLHGYETSEFILKGEAPGEYVSVWLTDQIKVDWGLLQKTWDDVGSNQMDSEIPVEMVMNRNSFPLLVEAYEDDRLVMRAESIVVESRNFDRSVTEIPSGVKLMGFSDLMMNMFRQRR